MTLTAVPGVRVGHWTDPVGLTGVTVVVLPEPNVATVEVRGAAPGTRETALLAPGMKVETIQALVLTGGSAFGLAAVDGVVAGLAADGRGYPTPFGAVPIVPAAVIYDLGIGDPAARPDREAGLAAYRDATERPVEMGNVGAGMGATVAGWRGPDARRKGGLGSASAVAGDVAVGVLVVLNAVGDVFALDGTPLTGGPHRPVFPSPPPVGPLEATTLVAVVTSARLSRADLTRVTVRSQDALAACLRPGHTRYDGDAAFAVSAGAVPADLDVVAEMAFGVTGEAVEAALRAARTAGGVRAIGDEG